ncbi:hypothetical protein N7532_000008 [Penicillium argentinense]|uniref:Uncharacterized protein n=1 Tax=Penicillium argentinense TaxID=1131581 RepID=A0A9W9G4S9_9EURO|nr:uncharacterized protein N7532_000008 [Penicillium argentinense]KAJ5111963.1 hypothetical protein N7532_000008 [Penicillium argentinense]
MFFDSAAEEKIDVKTLPGFIRDNPDEFKNIFVRRFTHVKNLGSNVLHEYLHVILEDNSTDKWTRVIVERQAGTLVWGEAHDQVIVRRWPAGKGYKEHETIKPGYFPFKLEVMMSSGSSGGKVGDSPLPLVTRSFQKRDFSVELLAQLLLECHKGQPYYTPNEWNCYWFAARAFESHRVRIGRFDNNQWKYANWKGDISKILSPERWSKAVKEASKAFKNFLGHIPIDNPGGGHPTDHKDPDVSQADDVFVGTLREVQSHMSLE